MDWLAEEKKYLEAIKEVQIPDKYLTGVPYKIIKNESDVKEIDMGGGCYWIWTNEPIKHQFHKNLTPEGFNDGEIIYNGIAKDDVKSRIEHHLFGKEDAKWSGISIDLYVGSKTKSHRKKIFGSKGKVPYFKSEKILGRKTKEGNKGDKIPIWKPVRDKADCDFLSIIEIETLKGLKQAYFRNGIDVKDAKHTGYEFRVYYIVGLKSLYLDFIEKKWREEYGLPKLCSYSSGR
jgi:hypothetical protein